MSHVSGGEVAFPHHLSAFSFLLFFARGTLASFLAVSTSGVSTIGFEGNVRGFWSALQMKRRSVCLAVRPRAKAVSKAESNSCDCSSPTDLKSAPRTVQDHADLSSNPVNRNREPNRPQVGSTGLHCPFQKSGKL